MCLPSRLAAFCSRTQVKWTHGYIFAIEPGLIGEGGFFRSEKKNVHDKGALCSQTVNKLSCNLHVFYRGVTFFLGGDTRQSR